MKNLIFAFAILAVACKKEQESVTTILELKTTNYRTGEPYPYLKFDLTVGNEQFSDSSNAYGHYHHSFIQAEQDQFNIDFLQPMFYQSGVPGVTPGVVNTVDLQVAPYADFRFFFDCSGTGPGLIREVSFILPESFPAALKGKPESYEDYIWSPECAIYYPARKVFAGEWIVQYYWKPHTSASTWTLISDTIDIQPGENYVHTILY